MKTPWGVWGARTHIWGNIQMAKSHSYIKLQVKAGSANPSPPVGPVPDDPQPLGEPPAQLVVHGGRVPITWAAAVDPQQRRAGAVWFGGRCNRTPMPSDVVSTVTPRGRRRLIRSVAARTIPRFAAWCSIQLSYECKNVWVFYIKMLNYQINNFKLKYLWKLLKIIIITNRFILI